MSSTAAYLHQCKKIISMEMATEIPNQFPVPRKEIISNHLFPLALFGIVLIPSFLHNHRKKKVSLRLSQQVT